MKLYTGLRQTGNTERMIRDTERLIRDAIFNIVDPVEDWKMLIVTSNYTDSKHFRDKCVDLLRNRGVNIPEYNNSAKDIIFQVKEGMKITLSARTENDVTLGDLKKYDCVIVDDVFEAHPFKEKILIRATVE